ncbi:GGDEF domain-containing protein [Photobacterium rosenbergii]|uniref:GGDEF domain-containing protein n=1 Tax=Photobacterium rosenbergii TaxID=294936 RepID=A0ABU3ZEZ9_9GAMM|nr:GGDEF domain-containing protein [Photobacterium rosenbergii]MDV5168675.1 GGDEF domain-containing protein [Photobacterium rosenbergii]
MTLAILWIKQNIQLRKLKSRFYANQRFNISTTAAGLGVWEWDLTTGKIYFNPYLFQFYGIQSHRPLNFSDWRGFLSHWDAAKLESLSSLAGKSEQQILRLSIASADSHSQRVVELLACGLPGDPNRLVGTQRDITAALSKERSLHQAAYEDPLTGLSNLRALEIRLSEYMEQGKLLEAPFALMFIDLDGFKVVNDTLGHDTGDILLKLGAKRMRSCMRIQDEVFRLGGDEFVIWIQLVKPNSDIGVEPNTSAKTSCLESSPHRQHLDIIATKLQRSLANPFTIAHENCHVTASIGIAIFPDDALSAESLISAADSAMYNAKHAGKNRYIYFSDIAEAERDTAKAIK